MLTYLQSLYWNIIFFLIAFLLNAELVASLVSPNIYFISACTPLYYICMFFPSYPTLIPKLSLMRGAHGQQFCLNLLYIYSISTVPRIWCMFHRCLNLIWILKDKNTVTLFLMCVVCVSTREPSPEGSGETAKNLTVTVSKFLWCKDTSVLRFLKWIEQDRGVIPVTSMVSIYVLFSAIHKGLERVGQDSGMA